MISKSLLILLILIAFLILLSGCVFSQKSQIPDTELTKTTASITVSSSVIFNNTWSPIQNPTSANNTSSTIFGFRRVIWKPGTIWIFGTANLKDGTRLSFALCQNGQPVSWEGAIFPRTPVNDGIWIEEFEPGFGKDGPYRFPDFGPGYSIQIFEENNVNSTAIFDLPFPGPIYTPTTELLKSQWRLISLNGKGLIPGTNITAVFDEPHYSGWVRGDTTVNGYGGFYEADIPNNLIIYGIGKSTLGGPEDRVQQEHNYLRCLRKVFSYKLIDNHLEIYDELHVKMLVFEKVP